MGGDGAWGGVSPEAPDSVHMAVARGHPHQGLALVPGGWEERPERFPGSESWGVARRAVERAGC